MTKFKESSFGIILATIIAVLATLLGKKFTIIGGPVFGILLGLLVAFIPRNKQFEPGIKFTSKKILQYAIILLGFGMNLYQIFAVGSQSLLIILSTIGTALIIAYFLSKTLHIPTNIATLIGVGSSICGGSAIAATAPVIAAEDEDIATAISVIFLFNVIAALIFPLLGNTLGLSDTGFGMWAGTAINDTSSVVAASQTWSIMQGNDTALQYATIVKLTRTLAIIPITLTLAFYRSLQYTNTSTISTTSNAGSEQTTTVNIRDTFPWFILFFLAAAIINTVLPLPKEITHQLTTLSKFFITMALSAIGLNTNLVKLIKTGAKPVFLGFCCSISIMLVSLFMQKLLGIW